MSDDIFKKIKQLRNETGISIIECKKALLNNQLDIDKSILYLREKGILKAQLKSKKNTKEGLVGVAVSSNKKNAIIYEINCETDFVAQSTELKNFAKKIHNHFLNKLSNNEETNLYNIDLLNSELESTKIDLISKMGENIIIRRLNKLSTIKDHIIGYTHNINNNPKIATLILFDNFITECSQSYIDIAMQITAMAPKYISYEDIPLNILEQEKNINKDLSHFLKENVLLDQPFIKNNKITIHTLIQNNFKIIKFIRFEVGEELI